MGPGVTGRKRVRNARSEEHTSELQSRVDLVCRLLLEKKKREAEAGSPEDESCLVTGGPYSDRTSGPCRVKRGLGISQGVAGGCETRFPPARPSHPAPA